MSARSLRRMLCLSSCLALIASAIAMGATTPATAAPSAGLMISAVYPAGGNSGALYDADFVELHNAGDTPVSLSGKSLQYRSSASTGNASAHALPEVSVPAHSYFLVQASSTGTTGAPLPRTPDASLALNLGAGGGQVVLAGSASAINPGSGTTIDYSAGKVIDFLGYGSATTYEKAVRALSGSPANAQAYWRTSIPLVDTDDNATDFTIGPATSYPLHHCECVAPAGLKITEIYVDGDQLDQGAPGYDHDFVEIQNTGSSAVVLTGADVTLQYRAPGATGAAQVVVPLSGTIAANSYDVIELAGTDGHGRNIPGVDLTASLDLSTGGTLAIVKGAIGRDLGTGAVKADQFVSDLVGWGTSNAFETASAAVTGLDRSASLSRAPGGVDTDVNRDDLPVTPSSPNAAPAIPTVTIAEIQGTGATTPMANAVVTTTGVVTAVYPSGDGQFAGFYLQTGGSNDPQASDAIFVYMGGKISPVRGSSVAVTGKVSEFYGMTELTPASTGDVTVLGTALPQPVLRTGIPGADCTMAGSTTNCLPAVALADLREKHEGELLDLSAVPFAVSDSYDGTPWSQPANRASQMAGEIGLAAHSDQPLFLPIERHNPRRDPAGHAAQSIYNEAHRLTLDDGAGVNYSATTGSAFPWLTRSHTVRVGASVKFAAPMILDYRNDLWKLQPQTPVGPGQIGTAQGITFEQDRPGAPDAVGGNVKIATFNMLNYFVHPAQEWKDVGGDVTPGTARTCSYYSDRAGEKLTANTCTWTDPRTAPATELAPGPRGAATSASLARQQAKEIAAITTMAADVVSLEELENSVKLGYADRDAALVRLVAALNAHWATTHPGEATAVPRWAFVSSPKPADQPTLGQQDAIRSGFIYNPRVVTTIGRSQILINSAPFHNAREPLAQAFRHVDGTHRDGFVVIVNHFKSKSGPRAPSGPATGDNADAGDGAGFYNGDRTRQATALHTFAASVSRGKGIAPVFLTGDFNAYGQEDPVLALEGSGWTNLSPSNGEASYSFGGLSGSLDHVFANGAAKALTTGQTVWPINANESVFYEYSRYNYNATDLYDSAPFRASDHNPEIIGITAPTTAPMPTPTVLKVGVDRQIWGRSASVDISVTPAAATGTVEVRAGTTRLGVATLAAGRASIVVPAKSLEVGSHTLVVTYQGSPTHAASQSMVTLKVRKQKPRLVVKAKQRKGHRELKVKAKIGTDGYVATGRVRFVVKARGARTIRVVSTVRNGKALARIKVRAGKKYVVRAVYLGDSHTRRVAGRTHVRSR